MISWGIFISSILSIATRIHTPMMKWHTNQQRDRYLYMGHGEPHLHNLIGGCVWSVIDIGYQRNFHFLPEGFYVTWKWIYISYQIWSIALKDYSWNTINGFWLTVFFHFKIQIQNFHFLPEGFYITWKVNLYILSDMIYCL